MGQNGQMRVTSAGHSDQQEQLEWLFSEYDTSASEQTTDEKEYHEREDR